MAGSLPDGPSARSRQALPDGDAVQVGSPLTVGTVDLDAVDADQQHDLQCDRADLIAGQRGEGDLGARVVVDLYGRGARVRGRVIDDHGVLATGIGQYPGKT